MRKYLDELGKVDVIMPDEPYGDDERQERWKQQKEECGFDDRETWSLNGTMAGILYEHLRMFMDTASDVINLEFYRFEVEKIVGWRNLTEGKITYPEPIFKKVEITQKECIETMIEYLGYYIKEPESDDLIAGECMAIEYGKAAFRIFAEVLPAMWW